MNELAARYAGRGVGSVFVYTHEAHPGEYYPHLTSMDQKYRHAAALRDVLGVSRPILLDALDGACHRTYGSMPNMTWIFSSGGIPIYKSDWTDANSVENAIQYFLDVSDRRRARERLAPFRVERLDYRNQDAVRRLKPATEAYQMAAERLGISLGEIRLVAAHAWDIAGALRASCAAAFVARPGMLLDPLVLAPDIVGADMGVVIEQILAVEGAMP